MSCNCQTDFFIHLLELFGTYLLELFSSTVFIVSIKKY